MINKTILKKVLLDNQKDIERYQVVPRNLPSDEFPLRVFIGVRRAGKSFMLYQKIQERLASGIGWDEMLYLNFEDDRLAGFAMEDFDLILACHNEMYDKRPMLFLDEIQNVDGWEKFARRLADSKYSVWITGSNAKMLSSEIMEKLGGRYLTTEVYPYGFREYLEVGGVPYDEMARLGMESRGRIVREWNEYLSWGGLPESYGLSVKRDYLSSVFQKIYLNDIALNGRIPNAGLLRLLIKKLAENVCNPVSYNRLAGVLSSVSGKVTMPTVQKYIEASENAWLILRLRNVSAPFAERESLCKYYFIDNGVLNLFLLDGETALLENVVALALFRKYGHDRDNERVFLYKDANIDVDFYVPKDALAVQASFSISKSKETFDREVEALKKLPAVKECSRRIILTNDESDVIADEYGNIEVMPVWSWLLTQD